MGFNISRYRERIHKEFEVEVVTPMFLGGANVNEAELRTPSLKGMLRFWWRATCGISDIQEMKKNEAKIFGDTSYKAPFSAYIENVNHAVPLLKNLPKGETFEVKSSKGTFRLGIIDYLAYGLRDQKKGYLRQHFPVGTKFNVNFIFFNEEYENEVLKAFYSLVNFGGLGARSRNGFGCLSINANTKPSITMEGPLKSYSATSANSDLFIAPKTNYGQWQDALSAIGMVYKDARLSLEKRHIYEKRSLIGKPIVQDREANSNQRHAKPYYLHVGKTASDHYYGQILYMPYKYMAGQDGYSNERFRKYTEAGIQMNNKIKELFAGGAK
ncbi:type III-B CRISPR module RAMP protein Cmr1 [Desulfococcus sp.]|uniref:type III-B CRISPR module RAMP protein Cmr1 n=1 Tax=Desulfococcus sp. TaxID=2025834 RepID=UPI003594653E